MSQMLNKFGKNLFKSKRRGGRWRQKTSRAQLIIFGISYRKMGLKQIFVAEKAGMTSQQFTDILNNRRLLRVEHLEPLARALGVGVEDLIS